ncbi:MAG TPA: alpha/beta hydrolase [Xanthobacteraceae bacterium]
MKLLFYAALFIACALGSAVESLRAQTVAIDSTVKQSLLALITDLRSKIERQSAGDQSAYFPQGPINPSLLLLGPPVDVLLSAPVAAQGLFNFNARVIHQNGASEWSLGTFNSGQIATYTFAISVIRPSRSTGQTFGPSGSTSQIFGGPNSMFNNPGAIFRGGTLAGQQPLPHAYFDQPAFDAFRQQAQPGPPAQQITIPPPPPAVDPRVVEFLFASTRQAIAPSPSVGISYSGERGPLTFGAASVRIPEDHKIGRIELPGSWSLFGLTLWTSSSDEREHFVIKRVVPLSEDTFGQVVRAKGAHTALVFVHGFNTTFEDALYRNAQIVWDLQYTGLPVLFTWASRGQVADYIYDKDSAYLAREAFVTLLKKLKDDYGVDQITVLAHSMGNLIALDALANYAKTSNPIQIARLVMAAPDVDRDEFKALAPMAKAIVGGMTLYASSADRAMVLSRELAGGIPRAGDVPTDGPIILPNIETIDVTAVGNDIFGLNHNVFASSRDVLEDISLLLRVNLPPPRLVQIRAVPGPPSVPTYWKYVP